MTTGAGCWSSTTGASAGPRHPAAPRQDVDHRRHREDFRAAVADGLAALTGRGRLRAPGAVPRPRVPGTGRAIATAVLADLARRATRRPPRTIAFEGVTGPTFRNEMCARGIARIAFNRPVRDAGRVTCPTLLVVAEYDEFAPSTSVREAVVAREVAFLVDHLSSV